MSAFAKFRECRQSILSDAPLPGERTSPFGGPYIVAIVPNDDARRFIVEACNTHVERPEPEPEPFGWYAGLSEDRLSVGPLPSWEAAYEAARIEHGGRLPIVIVEARPARGDFRPFVVTASRSGQVLDWIEEDNGPSTLNGVLPPLRYGQETDLADMLSDAVEAWAAKHGIKIITARLGEARTKRIVLADEVDRIEFIAKRRTGGGIEFVQHTRPMDAITDGICAAIDGVEVDVMPEPPAPAFVFEELNHCAGCEDPMACRPQGCKRKLARLRAATFAPSPHTGDMTSMLDDVRNVSC